MKKPDYSYQPQLIQEVIGVVTGPENKPYKPGVCVLAGGGSGKTEMAIEIPA